MFICIIYKKVKLNTYIYFVICIIFYHIVVCLIIIGTLRDSSVMENPVCEIFYNKKNFLNFLV